MPIYEYYCEPCNGVFELLRPTSAASKPQPCPECDEDAARMVSRTFSAFTVRDGLPRRLPDTGGYWHFNQSVSSPITGPSYQGMVHPELEDHSLDAPSMEEIEHWEQILETRRATEAEINGTVIDGEFERAKTSFAERVAGTTSTNTSIERAKRRLVQRDLEGIQNVQKQRKRRAR